MRLSDLGLLLLQVDALFTHDLDGRIRRVNEPDGDPAPRFFFGRTGEGNLWRYRYDVPADIVDRLEHLAASEPVTNDLRMPPANLQAFRDVLGGHDPVSELSAGPAYHFPADIPRPANTVVITHENAALLKDLVTDVERVPRALAPRHPWIVVVEQGTGVASCFCARITGRAAEAGVWTLEAFRGRGYAADAVAAWAHAVRDMGRIPLYSTSWDNLASQAVARKLGLIQYATDLSLS